MGLELTTLRSGVTFKGIAPNEVLTLLTHLTPFQIASIVQVKFPWLWDFHKKKGTSPLHSPHSLNSLSRTHIYFKNHILSSHFSFSFFSSSFLENCWMLKITPPNG